MNIDLEPVREVMAADGVALTLLKVDGGTAHLTMSVVDAECAECVLPKEFLEPVVLGLLKPNNPGLAGIVIIDPRETDSSEPAMNEGEL